MISGVEHTGFDGADGIAGKQELDLITENFERYRVDGIDGERGFRNDTGHGGESMDSES